MQHLCRMLSREAHILGPDERTYCESPPLWYLKSDGNGLYYYQSAWVELQKRHNVTTYWRALAAKFAGVVMLNLVRCRASRLELHHQTSDCAQVCSVVKAEFSVKSHCPSKGRD